MTKILKLCHSVENYPECDMIFSSTILVLLCEICLCQQITNIGDIQTLSELPLEKLLSLKKVFQPEEARVESIDAVEEKSSERFPEALALRNQKPIKDRGGSYQYYEEEYHPKEEKNKIQKLFQISVTSLAFLAFGGYLLCLLIHAINQKKDYYYSNQSATTAQSVVALLAARLRQKKKNLRPRIRKRPAAGSNAHKTHFNRYRRDELHNRTRRDASDDMMPDKMYDALINLAEGFTSYHTIDYVHLNRSHTLNRNGFF